MEIIESKRSGQKILLDGFVYTKKTCCQSSGRDRLVLCQVVQHHELQCYSQDHQESQ